MDASNAILEVKYEANHESQKNESSETIEKRKVLEAVFKSPALSMMLKLRKNLNKDYKLNT